MAQDLDSGSDVPSDMGSEGTFDPELFYSMVVKPGAAIPLESPVSEEAVIRLTSASFGEQVKPNSRTVLMAKADNETETALCVLTRGVHECHRLDLVFNAPVNLRLVGSNPSPVHLTGFLDPNFMADSAPSMDDVMEEELADEEIEARMRMQTAANKRTRGMAEESDDEMEEADTELAAPAAKKRRKGRKGEPGAASPKASPKQSPKQSPGGEKEGKKKRKKNKKKNKGGEEAPPTSPGSPSGGKGKKSVIKLKGGLTMKNLKEGSGPGAKNGQTLRVLYVGQLAESKQIFDKNIAGDGFKFTLGKGNVIKGWDMGLKGMKVGGKRKLTIPAKFAYGPKGSGTEIPPNSDLVFTVELKAIE